MAEDSEVLFGVEFLVSTGGDIAHGHEGAGFDVCSGEFPRLPNVDEASLVFTDERGCVGWGNFEFEHEFSLVGRASRLE